jgi:hypothetical protein
MAVSTVRPDGWPQTTIVGYANQGFDIFFMIFRSSQKFSNIRHNPHISIAVSDQSPDITKLQAVYAGAVASEVTDPPEREAAWKLLAERHPNLADFDQPDSSETAIIRARCKHVSVLDYTQGPGHTETLTLGSDETPVETGQRKDAWGSAAGKTP